MSTTTIRVSERTHQKLTKLAREAGTPMSDLVDQAVEMLRRQRILERINADYAALRTHPEAWAEELAERAAWDVTLTDGLPKE